MLKSLFLGMLPMFVIYHLYVYIMFWVVRFIGSKGKLQKDQERANDGKPFGAGDLSALLAWAPTPEFLRLVSHPLLALHVDYLVHQGHSSPELITHWGTPPQTLWSIGGVPPQPFPEFSKNFSSCFLTQIHLEYIPFLMFYSYWITQYKYMRIC